MAQIARITTWASGQTLTASALNAEFNNIVTAWNNIDSTSSAWTALSVTGALTVGGNCAVTGTITGTGRLNSVANVNTGETQFVSRNTSSAVGAVAGLYSDNGTTNTHLQHFGTGYTGTLFSITLANCGLLESSASSSGLLFNTAASASITFGTNSTKAMTIDTSQNVNIPNTKLQCGANQVFPILQVVTGSSTTNKSATSNVFADTNLTASITPKFSTSKILVMAMGQISAGAGTCCVTLARAGSNLLGTNGGAETTLSSTTPCFLQIYDSPATTSSTTYSVQLRNTDNSSSIQFGATSVTQYLTLMEIAQ